MDPLEFLESAYQKAMEQVGSGKKITTTLDSDIQDSLRKILARSESAKGVLTVVITSVVYKILHPEQDIRKHQTSITGGYSGRSFDSKYITPFLQDKSFPAMSSSGWLTRSLEQKQIYDKDYRGAIQPPELKKAFLSAIAFIQEGKQLDQVLSYMFQSLIIDRNAKQISLSKPHNLPIQKIIDLMVKHFNAKYTSEGASRLPVLALYAVYQCLVPEVRRFEGKSLVPIESHTSADSRSGRIGDVEIVDEYGKSFEGVEVKFDIPISVQIVKTAFDKFKTTQVKRYYLLSTANIDEKEKSQVEGEIERIKNIHGCHVIANGLTHSLTYYLRLIANPSEFIENYVRLIEKDSALKFEHKERWNQIISESK